MESAVWKEASSSEKYVEITDQFERKWNFGNCMETIDGNHKLMQSPSSISSSYLFNYKKHTVLFWWLSWTQMINLLW